MNSSNDSIDFLQAFMILMLMNGLSSHVIVNPSLLDSSGRDAWISVLLTGVVFMPWCALIAFFMKRSGGQKLQPWLAQQTGTVVSWLLLLPVCLLLYLIGITTVIHTAAFTATNYMPATPKLVLVLAVVSVCAYCAVSGIRTIAVSSGILLPIVIVLGYFVAFSNIPQKDFKLLRPMLEHGWKPVFHGAMYAGGSLFEIVTLLLMQHRIKSTPRAWQVMLLGAVLVYIMLGPVIGAITEFGYKEAAKQLESPYEQWRLVKLGNYIEHVDFLSVFQWLSGATIRISLALFLLGDLLPFNNAKQRNRFILWVSLSFIVISMLPIEKFTYFTWMYGIYSPATFAVIGVVTLAVIVISAFAKHPEEKRA